ncbi:MAG: DNA methyltransferase [Burkholderiales bacterium]
MSNALFFGDNLEVLRESLKDESVDLVYLDPPFNSNATYNVLFKTPKGHESDAQIEAFDDTWHWGVHAEAAFADIMQGPNTDVAEVIRALRTVLGENDMMAYLTMMAIRLLELHRVLKPSGSLYLHCDPTASHYLKVVLDAVFGGENYRNEIIWKRSHAHNSAKGYGANHDVIFFYSKTAQFTWNPVYQEYEEAYLAKHYRHFDTTGRRYKHENPTGAGVSGGDTGKPWRGIDPTAKGRHWAKSPEEMDRLDAKGLIYWPPKGEWPYIKVFLDERKGIPAQDIWSDVDPINMIAKERLGYPTQKPIALLERIIAASSNAGDMVLDPFCGCGTAVHAAEKLGRKWIGIDVTHLAVSLIEKRMRDAFPGIEFEVHGTPKDLDGARDLALRDKYQFQWWACSLVNAQPYGGKKKGADGGIDGLIYFQHDAKVTGKIIVSVKSGDNVNVSMIRDLAHVVESQKAAMGFFVTLAPATKPMITEAASVGFYTSPLTGVMFPKLQLLTIEGLLSGGEQAKYPRMDAGGLTFKKATKEEQDAEQKKLF